MERLLSFGMCRVPGTECILEFLEWKKVEPQGKPLTQIWLRFSGVPSKLIRDVRVAASLGILVGRPERVDMPFTRANGVARVLVSVLDIEFVPDVVKWTHKGLVYNIDTEFEDSEFFAEALAGMDVDRHDKNDGSGNSEERQGDDGHELPRGPVADPQTPGNGAAPSTIVPMSTLRFGSFPAASAPPRLWSDRVDSEDMFEHTLPSLDFAEAMGSPVGRDGLQQVTFPLLLARCWGGLRQD